MSQVPRRRAGPRPGAARAATATAVVLHLLCVSPPRCLLLPPPFTTAAAQMMDGGGGPGGGPGGDMGSIMGGMNMNGMAGPGMGGGGGGPPGGGPGGGGAGPGGGTQGAPKPGKTRKFEDDEDFHEYRLGKAPDARSCPKMGCTWDELGCDLQFEETRLYCFFLNIAGPLFITDVPDTVERFEMQGNNVTWVDPRSYDHIRHQLQVFNAADNHLSGLDLSGMPALKQVDLQNNWFVDVPTDFLLGAPNLETVYFSDNQLKRRPSLEGLDKLTTILFDVCGQGGCEMRTLGCSTGTGWVSCQKRGIKGPLWLTDLPPGTGSLYLQGNAITSLDRRTFAGSEDSMMFINLSDNPDLSLDEDTFSALTDVKSLSLKGIDKLRDEHATGWTCPFGQTRSWVAVGRSGFWACPTAPSEDDL